MRWIAVLLVAGCAAAPRRCEGVRGVMGTRARIVCYAADDAAGRAAIETAFERIERLEAILSHYRADSELMRLCDGAGGPPRTVGPDLFAVLERSVAMARASDGAFDVTVGPMVALWRRARETGRLPDAAARAVARRLVGVHLVALDPARRTVRLARAGMRLDLGGVGKGYAGDEARRVLARKGAARCLVDIGGDIVCGAAPPGRRGWRVRAGGATRRIAHRAVAASGDTERAVEIAGVRYSHIVDPRTGLGVTHGRTVTVLAATGAEADALASALSVLDEARGRALAAARGAEVLYSAAPRTTRNPVHGASASHHALLGRWGSDAFHSSGTTARAARETAASR